MSGAPQGLQGQTGPEDHQEMGGDTLQCQEGEELSNVLAARRTAAAKKD